MTDFKGTSPGLAAGAIPTAKTINLKCKGQNGKCPSIQAQEIVVEQTLPNEAPRTRLYRCVSCGETTVLSVGGSIHI